MKKIKYLLILLAVIVIGVTQTSCSNFLDVNTNPNSVTESNVTANLIFPQCCKSIGDRAASRFIFLNNWMGYWSRSGTFTVETEEASYDLSTSFTENNWAEAYNILFDLHQTQEKALAAGDSALVGAAKVLSVKLWQETVDQFGDIPYSQAFDNTNHSQPAYDKQADIYADLLKQLDQAVAYLHVQSPKSSFTDADIIFSSRGGDRATSPLSLSDALAEWNRFANTIRLRILLRQSSKLTSVPTAELAKITANGGLLLAGEDVAVNPGYVNDVDKQNPFYANFGLTPSGAPATTNNKANNYFYKIIMGTSTDDPRLNYVYSAPISGTDYGALNGTKVSGGAQVVGTDLGPGLVKSATSDQFIMPSFEVLFMEAEAIERGWLTGDAQQTYNDAVTQSFIWLGVPNAASVASTFLSNNAKASWAGATTTDAKIKLIAYQKYIAMNGVDPLEAYSDLRRGVLVLPDGYLSYLSTRKPHLPYVLPYPLREYTSNSSNVPSRTDIQTEKLFWMP